jgi:hypothetical protein
MARKQNPEQPVGEIIAESATVKSRSFGSCRFAILGRVAAEPALRYTAGGKAVLDLTLATTAAGVATFHTVVFLWNHVRCNRTEQRGRRRSYPPSTGGSAGRKMST